MHPTLQALKLSATAFKKLLDEGFKPKTTEDGVNYLLKEEEEIDYMI